MSLSDLLPNIDLLSKDEKAELIAHLLKDISSPDSSGKQKDVLHVPIGSVAHEAYEAAAILQKMLKDDDRG